MERKINKIDPAKVKTGDVMAIVYYVRVKSAYAGGDQLVVQDLDTGIDTINIQGKELVKNCFSADQYSSDEKVTKTEAAELLVSSHNRPLTVCFEKQDGSERIMRGRLVKAEPLLGRSMVEDLEQGSSPKERMRLVDHRTIKWLVVDGTRYAVKGKE
jgi:hypothetical protein